MVYRKEPVSGNRYGWRTDHGYASDATDGDPKEMTFLEKMK